MSIADRLAENNHIRYDALRLECIKARSSPTIARLNLVGDAHPTGLAHVTIDLGQVSLWENDLPSHAGAALGDEPGQTGVTTAQAFDRLQDVVRIPFCCTRVAGLVWASIDIGNRHGVHPRWRSAAAGAVVLVGADVDQRRGVSVVGAF